MFTLDQGILLLLLLQLLLEFRSAVCKDIMEESTML